MRKTDEDLWKEILAIVEKRESASKSLRHVEILLSNSPSSNKILMNAVPYMKSQREERKGNLFTKKILYGSTPAFCTI